MAEVAAALIGNSLSLLGDAATMIVDSLTYVLTTVPPHRTLSGSLSGCRVLSLSHSPTRAAVLRCPHAPVLPCSVVLPCSRALSCSRAPVLPCSRAPVLPCLKRSSCRRVHLARANTPTLCGRWMLSDRFHPLRHPFPSAIPRHGTANI